MRKPFQQYVRLPLWCGFISTLVVLASVRCSLGLSPDSPEVKKSLARAVKFLENGGASDDRLGARALVGLVMLKSGKPLDHPAIVRAVEAIKARLSDANPKKLPTGEPFYGLMISGIFLTELNPNEYRPEIECLLAYLQHFQKEHGGWGYPMQPNSDTSMTQYGVLFLWEVSQAGYRVPLADVEKVAIWLLSTQDPGGGHAYQGRFQAPFQLISQTAPYHSMTAAGLGSIYVCSDLLGLTAQVRQTDKDLPTALKRIETERENGSAGQVRTRIDSQRFREAQARGMGWMANNYKIDPPRYTHYFLYALERCMSFRELSEGKIQSKEGPEGAKWYNDGAQYLMRTQNKNGSWKNLCGVVPDTAFGMLFLMRSTKRTIQKVRNFGEGTLISGRGFPKETEGARIRDGNIVAKPRLDLAEELREALENQKEWDVRNLADLVVEVPSQDAASLIGQHLDRFKKMVAAESPAARLAAVRALARSRNLDVVPVLIYALSDPDPEVLIEARDALRRISRKPLGFGLPDDPTAAERVEKTSQWKAWYLAFRPDAEFEEF